jgi:hypothetical protein
MRILLLGDDVKCIDLSSESADPCDRLNAELTAQALAGFPFCVFDSRLGVEPGQHSGDFRRQLDVANATALIIPYSGGDWLTTVRNMPARIQTLVPGVAQGAAIAVRTENLLRLLPFQDMVDPVRDALIRLVAQTPGASFAISETTLPTSDTTQLLPRLAPGMSPRASELMMHHLNRFVPEELKPVLSAEDAVALTAGLFLMHDCLDRSHALSQDVQGAGRHGAGDYWHAIMHRREPDYGNSKYWYRQVGRHPIFTDMARATAEEFSSADDNDATEWSDRIRGGGDWNPFAWVDFCEAMAGRENSVLHAIARRIQWHEMLLLLRQTARDAFGDD